MQDQALTADVIIVGTGAAGFAAAATVAELGGSVIMIEKMSYIGGNTLRASGTHNAVDPARQQPVGIEDTSELFFQQTFEAGDYVGTPELIRIMVENAYDARHWLEGYGAKWNEYAFQAVGGLWPRSVSPTAENSAADIFIYNLRDFILEHKANILTEVKAEEILMRNGKACGIYAHHTRMGQQYILQANKAVILACGGYAANAEMIRKFANLVPLNTSNQPGATGDGIALAVDVGAALVNMEYVQLHPHGNPKTGALMSAIRLAELIYVNTEGLRFTNESGSWSQITQAMLAQPSYAMYAVFDSTLAKTNIKLDQALATGDAVTADTLDGLSVQMGIPPATLKQTIRIYNENIRQGRPDEYGKGEAIPLDNPPYYAMLLVPVIHNTMGGIQINPKAQVIDLQGNVISGLYAAGEVAGGIHGATRVGGNGLIDAVIFGRIAGETAMHEEESSNAYIDH